VNLGAIPGMAEIEKHEVPDLRSFLLPRTDYQIDDNWHVAGLAGTGSKDIVVDNAFVPEYRSQSHWDYTLGRPLAGWEINPGPLYRLPWAVVFNWALASLVIGASRGFLDRWIDASLNRKAGLSVGVKEDPFSQKLLSEASYAIDSAALIMRHDTEQMMELAEAGEPFSLKYRARLRYNACRSAQIVAATVDRLFEASSGRIIFQEHALQRPYQDVKAMSVHPYLNCDVPGRWYGAMSLGVPILEFLL
jgi:3-hydroxy-9,10-secoandrosta-1,3,5(10)-triene-9,17-dione monooxygenase